ncbi:M13 family peptidase [Mycoplasma sp. NEAQ87857]|uniref:M13 family metallopeptidase n=1 Tax=Mycoplasma sp. NEAQ87857 TaxID=2683967 RepID=UPI00131611E3|nr:M13 family metallopeptidase [Mycoplasma sp. NEAQ87857]QGZ97818.1 M13 family peptidase [Mycoplasma sp. NEAQ87857]
MSKINLKDDYYAYVNQKWLSEAKVPADRSSISAFDEMDLNLEKLLKNLTKDWATGAKELPSDILIQQYVKFYQMILDQDKRKELGWTPARKDLEFLENLTSFEEIKNNYKEMDLKYTSLPLAYGVAEDFIDNTKKILWLYEFKTILPSKETYANEQEKTKLLQAWSNMMMDLLVDYGKSKEEAQRLIDLAIEFDNLYKDFVLSSVEAADYVARYNLFTKEQLANKSKQFDLVELGEKLVDNKVESIAIYNPRLVDNLDQIFNENTFESYKAFLFINNLHHVAQYLTEELRIKAVEFRNFVYSVDKYRSLEDYAYDLASKYFKMPVGMYYANEYFGEKAKLDVEQMVQKMIGIYEDRLTNNDWLSKETIQKAKLKLSKLGIMVGFPEEINSYYKDFIVQDYDQGGSVYSNVKYFNKLMTIDALSKYLQKTNPKLWSMSPATINAYFHPFHNHIVFPAAILSAPFYDINQSKSANYGGIGAVIAHEISHAFDNNGSQFDENGSLNNWWTDQDRTNFEQKVQAVVELFDQRETWVGPVNGKLTVSENIADIGGFLCALEAAQLEEDFNAKEFFDSWVTIWRAIYKEGAAKRLLENDVHAPAKERGNVQLMNCDLFNEYFDLQPEDQMYLAPEKRIKIW